jgi:hypothetical protein
VSESKAEQVAGPFESEQQARGARDALRPMYFRPLVVVGGHMVDWSERWAHRLE